MLFEKINESQSAMEPWTQIVQFPLAFTCSTFAAFFSIYTFNVIDLTQVLNSVAVEIVTKSRNKRIEFWLK